MTNSGKRGEKTTGELRPAEREIGRLIAQFGFLAPPLAATRAGFGSHQKVRLF
jgi:hypothetical protein